MTALYEIIPLGPESEFLATVDDLKYQKAELEKFSSKTDELLHVKFRYKAPDGNKSKLLQKPVINNDLAFDATSANFRWSAAVASFGMLLRDSKYKGDTSYDQVENWANAAKGKDEHGYRHEFLQLVRGMGAVASR